jgi:beta-glucosidase
MSSNTAFDVASVLAQMTQAEKIQLCSGANFWQLPAIERLGIPSLYITDGPQGVRKQAVIEGIDLDNTIPATCFPTASALASSWDRSLMTQIGAAIAVEAQAMQVSVVLGPGVNIKRSPLGGRNFEYFSEDPMLSSHLAAAYIEGVQSHGIGTSIKHFAANNQEARRMTIDTIVDERALREIYLASFEHAVKTAQPWTVMCAYNGLNGELCSQNHRLLTSILRKEWGFTGTVVSDWGAVYQRVPSILAGMDLEMPSSGGAHDADIAAALASGALPQAVFDQTVTRILTMIAQSLPALVDPRPYDQPTHHALARRAAAEGMVLLKNDGALLPLPATQSVAVIGAFAKTPRYQGAGSSLIAPSQLDTVYDSLVSRLGADAVHYAAGYIPRKHAIQADLMAEAVDVARHADVVVLCVGLPDIDETEGVDRTTMAMPDSHNALIAAVAAVNPNVVVVLSNGAPIQMPWQAQVPAIIEAYLGGQAVGSAIVDVLYGDVNPSGKLAETFPFQWQDHPAHTCFPGSGQSVEYRESIYVGYRYYNTVATPVQYPFGYGMSYTTFAYSDIAVSATTINAEESLTVTAIITNTGTRAGAEVVQLYVRDVASTVFRPQHELKDFVKVLLQPGESQQVQFVLNKRSFAYYDVPQADWVVETGQFEVQIGASSRDIRLTALVDVVAPPVHVARTPLLEPYYQPQRGAFGAEAFAALCGRDIRVPRLARGQYTLNTPVSDMRDSWLARLLHSQLYAQTRKMSGHDPESPTAIMFESMAKEMPMRSLLMLGGGVFSLPMLDAIMLMINGYYWKGLRALIASRKRK